MQTRLIAMVAAAIAGVAGPADAQRLAYPQTPFPQTVYPAGGPAQRIGQAGGGQITGQRWGGQVQGRWAGGYYAPGGWNAYRRPSRGWTLPRYWIAPSFFIGNYASYGLSVPRPGYRWTRYYDDAVLINESGRVYDMISGIDWDRYEGGYQQGYQGQGYQGQSYQQGYQVQPGYGATYAQPGYGFQGTYQGHYTQSPGVVYAPPAEVAQPVYGQGYGQSYSQTYASGGYAGSYSGSTIVNGIAYPASATTTITIASAPVVTTTTTEYIDEVEYRAPRVRKVYHRPVRKWRPVRRQCSCNCGCR